MTGSPVQTCDTCGEPTWMADGAYRFCACHRRAQSQRANDMPQKYRRARLDSPSAEIQKKAYSVANRWCACACGKEETKNGAALPWLWIYGPPQLGKTWLAAAIHNALAANLPTKKRVWFRDVITFYEQLKQPFSGECSDYDIDHMEEAKSAHVCILDDLGASRQTDFQQQKLEELIFHRHERDGLMVITSNLDLFNGASVMRDGRMMERLRLRCLREEITDKPRQEK